MENFVPLKLSITISSLSFLILENVKKIERQKIIGNKYGIIEGSEKKTNLKKILNGNPLLIDNSINCTLLLNEKIDRISNNISIEFIINCFRIYLSINFIESLLILMILIQIF